MGDTRKEIYSDFILRINLFQKDYIKTLLEQHQKGIKKNNKIIFSLIIFKKWLDKNPDLIL